MKLPIDEDAFLQIDFLDMYFTHAVDSPQKISLDIRNKIITITSYNLSITVGNESHKIVIPTHTLEQALSDPNSTYYRFDTSRIAKYNHENGLYYTLNKKNEW